MADIGYNSVVEKYNRRVLAAANYRSGWYGVGFDGRLQWALPENSHIHAERLIELRGQVESLACQFCAPDTAPNKKYSTDADWAEICPYNKWSGLPTAMAPSGMLVFQSSLYVLRTTTNPFEYVPTLSSWGTQWVERDVDLHWRADTWSKYTSVHYVSVLTWLDEILTNCWAITLCGSPPGGFGYADFDEPYRMQYWSTGSDGRYSAYNASETEVEVTLTTNDTTKTVTCPYNRYVKNFPELLTVAEPVFQDYSRAGGYCNGFYYVTVNTYGSTPYVEQEELTVGYSYTKIFNGTRLPAEVRVWYSIQQESGYHAGEGSTPWTDISIVPTIIPRDGDVDIVTHVESISTDPKRLLPGESMDFGPTEIPFEIGRSGEDYLNAGVSVQAALAYSYTNTVIHFDFRKTFNELGEDYEIEE